VQSAHNTNQGDHSSDGSQHSAC